MIVLKVFGTGLKTANNNTSLNVAASKGILASVIVTATRYDLFLFSVLYRNNFTLIKWGFYNCYAWQIFGNAW